MADDNAEQGNTDTGNESESQGAGTEGEGLTPEQQAAAAAGEEGGTGAEGEGGNAGGNEGEGNDAVPETYEFTMPEGMEMDQELADAAGPIFKELGLTQEQANKLTEMYAGRLQAQQKAATDAFNNQLEGWANELKADKDFGGEKFNENSDIAFKAMEKFAGDDFDELKGIMDSTGIGNFPPLVRMFYRIGLAIKDDGGGDEGVAPTGQRSPEQLLYAEDGGKKQ